MRQLLIALLLSLHLTALAQPIQAAPLPSQAAEVVRAALFRAQTQLTRDPQSAQQALTEAQTEYQTALEEALRHTTAESRITSGFEQLAQALKQGDGVAFAVARAEVWTAVLAGSYTLVEEAVKRGDVDQAQVWLTVREFRQATRFARPNANATLALEQLRQNTLTPSDALLAVQADLLDTYQARLTEAVSDLQAADSNGYPMRRAENAALAAGYFQLLSAAYAEQRGPAALTTAQTAFGQLTQAALQSAGLQVALGEVQIALKNFRAAPLTAADQTRRANQLLRYLSLIPLEYGRGVKDGRVTRALEIQEALTFQGGAQAAFSDLQNLLDARDAAQTAQVAQTLSALETQLNATMQQTTVTEPEAIRQQVEALTVLLKGLMPAEWQKADAGGDFDVIASMLDQMVQAARTGQYDLAESARLEAYALLEVGPEARLMVFAPQLKLTIEELFWNGQGANKGLAALIREGASLTDIKASRAALDAALAEAQATLGTNSAPAAIATNAGMIVFREGLEAVLILASLLSSLKRADERKYRQPMWLGVILALVATALTWILAHGVLLALARLGETLEAIVSLIAIGVLLLITNWFFHKTYWNEWIAKFHAQKKRLISGEAGLFVGLMMLGFTSVYREGFETVLFMQALVLEGGTGVVLIGVVVALALVVGVGFVTFKFQSRLPYKKMLIVTGILIGGVLLQMVGNTVHILQVIGWLPIHVIEFVSLPYWLGTWFGLYPTWEGVLLQSISGIFVIGSYYLAEYLQKRDHQRPMTVTA